MILSKGKVNYFRVCDLEVDSTRVLKILICDKSFDLTIKSFCDNCHLFATELECEIRAGTQNYEIQQDDVTIKSGVVRIQ